MAQRELAKTLTRTVKRVNDDQTSGSRAFRARGFITLDLVLLFESRRSFLFSARTPSPGPCASETRQEEKGWKGAARLNRARE